MKAEEKNRAIELRKDGWSYKHISKSLKVSKSAVSRWCRHIELTVEQINKLSNNCRINSIIFGLKNKEKWESKRANLLNKYNPPFQDSEFMLGLGIYWGEGSKYNASTTELSNCDYKLLICFINWIKKYFSEDYSFFRVCIHHYSLEKDDEIKKYWSEKLGLSIDSFRKSIIQVSKSSKNKKGNIQLYGTAHVMCCGNGVWKIRQKIGKALDLITAFV
jgi:Homeodomain-like domain